MKHGDAKSLTRSAHAKGARRAAYGLSVREGVDAVFELTPKTARSRPAHDHDYFQIQQGQR